MVVGTPGEQERGAGAGMASPIDRLLATKEIVVACGPGGVGKTTTAAALGATVAARRRAKVLVLTIDPARRLADALGIEGIGNTARQVPAEAFRALGVTPEGELYAAMLDMKQSWDGLVRRHAPDATTAAQILSNPLYDNIASKFASSHEYIAMERLYEIHSAGDYDLVVVDTPPTRNALDFLEAPGRLADFFSSRLLRWLIVPSRSRLVTLASRPFYQVADKILGTQFLQDIAEFFMAFQTMYDGFVARAEAVSQLLRDERTTFMVVTTLESVPAREAEFFLGALRERRLDVGLLVVNKVLPAGFGDDKAADLARVLAKHAEEIAVELSSEMGLGDDPGPLSEVLAATAQGFLDFGLLAGRQAEMAAELRRSQETTVTVPFLDDEITDLAGLVDLGRRLFDGESTPRSRAGRQAPPRRPRSKPGR